MECENVEEERHNGEQVEKGAVKAMEADVDQNGNSKERKSARRGEKEEVQTVSFFELFSFANNYDYLLMVIGTFGAFGHGLAYPMFYFFFGKVLNSFGANQDDPTKISDVGRVSAC